MTEFRLVDLEEIRRLPALLEGLAAEAGSIAEGLVDIAHSEMAAVDRIASWAGDSAGFVTGKAAAALPAGSSGFEASQSLPGDTGAFRSAPTLDELIESSKSRVWDELWLVVAELNRCSELGVNEGRLFDGLLSDYNTLVRLIGTNLVYFAVDRSVPIGSRSGRAGYRAGVWLGPVSAEHVLVMIPGMNTTTAGWLDHNLADAERLLAEATALAEHNALGKVAVVPLLSYAAPQSFLEAVLSRRWKEGSRETAGVLASLPLEGRHVTGWGHSYGAAVLGAASARSAAFDDLIMVGGAGTGTETLAELGVGSDHLYVATNWNDPIRLVPNDYHGVSPASLPHVPVPTEPATDFDPWKAILSVPWFLIDGLPDHNYLEDNIALRAFAAIAVGLDELADRRSSPDRLVAF